MLSPLQKRMRLLWKRENWPALGKLMGFTPVYRICADGSRVIDWRSIPARVRETMASIPRLVKQKRPKPVKLNRPQWSNSHKKLRPQTYEAQEGFCYYCEKITQFQDWTIDHRTPLSRGGDDTVANKIGCCATCNRGKSCLTELEFQSVHPNLRKPLIQEIQTSLKAAK